LLDKRDEPKWCVASSIATKATVVLQSPQGSYTAYKHMAGGGW